MRHLPLVTWACFSALLGCRAAPSVTGDIAAATESSSKCDDAKIAALVGAVEAADPRAGPDLVAERLAGACALPEVFAGFFLRTAPSHVRAPFGHAGTQADDALATVCPGAAVIRAQVAKLARAERQAGLYDRCDFKRFELVDKDSWLRGDPSSPVPFYAHHWFIEQGLSAAVAKTLAMSMVLRDRKRWGVPGQVLTKVEPRLPAVPRAAIVEVTNAHIANGGHNLATISGGAIDPSALQGRLIGPLFDALAEQADLAQRLASGSGVPWDGTLVIVADASLPQKLIVNIMHTAERAEYSRYAFVVETGAFEYGAVLVNPSKRGASSDKGAAPDFQVHISSDGFGVRAKGAGPAGALLPNTAAGTPDFAALLAAAEAHIKTHDNARVAVLSADDDIGVGTVVKTLAALRGRRCGTNSWDCLLPELTLIAAPSDTFDPDVVVRRPGILGLLAGREGRPALASPQYGLNLEDGWGGLDQAFDIGGFGFGATSSGGGITVDGALAQDIIRRIVRAHTDEVRDCYAQGLDKDPDLHGRLKIAFEIAASGAVTSSTIKDSTLGEDGVGECIAQAVKRWKFPKPTGAGVVSVVYPFVLVSR